ncbi:MAG: hypothetical protein H6765_09630 [Candidatus Peribacteria bacterium]|nr:MAG: hypothetical protein H6765_09630 [Candidatus Peribacteria bacterium]
MVRKIFLVISIFLLTYLSFSFFREYFDYHTYYYKMLDNWANTKLVLNACIFALAPAAYLLFARRRNFWVVLALIFFSLFGYGLFYIAAK